MHLNVANATHIPIDTLVRAEWGFTSNRCPPGLDCDSPGHIVRQNRWDPAPSHGSVGCRGRIQQKVAVSFCAQCIGGVVAGIEVIVVTALGQSGEVD